MYADQYVLVVNLYLVTDRASSTISSGSLNVTLHGKEQVTLKQAQVSDDILQRKISRVTLALDNDTAIESIKVRFGFLFFCLWCGSSVMLIRYAGRSCGEHVAPDL